ncbi:MAG: hypothetical protein R2824_07460 [Saprospiraceae bacterium]|nr:hypothetical protein [Lewinella sp.]
MKTLSLFLLMICFSFTIQAQTLEGNWVITIPCDCSDKGEITWQWQVKADGTYAVDINVDGTVEVTGKYWVDGNKITVQNDEGCTEKGTYEYTVEADRLWMDPINDPCEDRKPPKKVFFTKG